MGLATPVGFDSAANLAEEAKDPFRTAPRAIVGSVVAAGILGMVFLITLTVAIEDVPRTSRDGSPVAAIMRNQLGPVLPGAALIELITASTILPAVVYGSTIVLHLAVRRRLGRKKGAFDLGRFELPVAICALVWTLVALCVLVRPGEALVSVVIVVGLLLVGGPFFLVMLIVDRETPETEPGDASTFMH
ncbi:amino acid permease [Streptomyces sp. NPDC002209]|uniref:amino acid permease n=1 Tax=Streptomyces sp. NPDC002209 TaxID=3364638 RepID=UPI0036ADCCAB